MTDVRISFGMPLSLCVRTDTGKVRSNNEDSWGTRWTEDGSLLVLVCDGMGGHEAGEVASRLAVDTIVSEIVKANAPDPRHRIYNAFLRANEAIVAEGQRIGRRGMGTTGVLAHVRGPEVFVGLVGDSRLLHIRRGHLVWRTLDHTRVQSLVDRGVISEEEARSHSDAGMLTRALGHARMSNGEALEPEVLREPLKLQQGDALVLCSDGCHDLLEDWEIARAVAGATAAEASDRLVSMALDRGGHDNVTVAVVVAGDRARLFDPSGAEGGEVHGLLVSSVDALAARGASPISMEDAGSRTEEAAPPWMSSSLVAAPGAQPAPAPPPSAPSAEERAASSRPREADFHPQGVVAARQVPAKPARGAAARTAARTVAPRPDAEAPFDTPGDDTPSWVWLVASVGVAMLILSLVMIVTAVWLAT